MHKLGQWGPTFLADVLQICPASCLSTLLSPSCAQSAALLSASCPVLPAPSAAVPSLICSTPHDRTACAPQVGHPELGHKHLSKCSIYDLTIINNQVREKTGNTFTFQKLAKLSVPAL